MSALRPSARDWGLFLVCVALWGSAYAAVRFALLDGAHPWLIAAGRLWIAALGLNAVLVFRRRSGHEPPPTPGVGRKLILMGVLGAAAPFSLLSFAQTQISSGLAAILSALTPLLVGASAPLVMREDRLTPPKIAGLLLGFTGVLVLIGPDALAGLGGPMIAGQIAAVLAAVSYAVNTLVARAQPSAGALEAAAGWTLWGALAVTPFAIDAALRHGAPGWQAWTAIAFLAIGPTGVASVAYFALIRSAGPTFVSQTNFALPVFAVALGALLFGEVLSWNAVWAFLLIAGGLAIAQGAFRLPRKAT